MDIYCTLGTGGTFFSPSGETTAEPGTLLAAYGESNATACLFTPPRVQMCLTKPSFNGKMLPRVGNMFLTAGNHSTRVTDALIERFPAADRVSFFIQNGARGYHRDGYLFLEESEEPGN